MESNSRVSELASNFFVFYCSIVWLVTRFNLPVGPFSNLPLYLPLTFLSFALLPVRATLWTTGFTIFLLAYEVLKSVQPGIDSSPKAMFSAIAVGLTIGSIGFSLNEILKQPEEKLVAWLKGMLYVYAASLAIEMVLDFSGAIKNAYHHYFLPMGRYSGTLPEPSHLGSVLAPFVFIVLNFPNYFWRKFGLGGSCCLFWIVLVGLSSTLMGVILLAAACSLVRRAARREFVGIAIAGIFGIAMLSAFLTIPDFYARIVALLLPNDLQSLYSDDAISALVIIKAFQMTTYGMAHFPLGVHVLNMDALAPYSEVSYLSDSLFATNSKDGASLLFKGLSEYGYLFAFLVVFAIGQFLKRLVQLREVTLASLIQLGLFFSLFGTFLRGTSYFHAVAPFALSIAIFGLCDALSKRLAYRNSEVASSV